MTIKYGLTIDNEVLGKTLDRITNQIYKLLPLREEGGDWTAPLENLIVELSGIDRLLIDQVSFFTLLSKMEGLLTLTGEDDFLKFRKNIFECLSILSNIKKCLD